MRKILTVIFMTTAVILAAGCTPAQGTVTDRTFRKVYVKRDDGIRVWVMAGITQWPHCQKGARWPACKNQ